MIRAAVDGTKLVISHCMYKLMRPTTRARAHREETAAFNLKSCACEYQNLQVKQLDSCLHSLSTHNIRHLRTRAPLLQTLSCKSRLINGESLPRRVGKVSMFEFFPAKPPLYSPSGLQTAPQSVYVR